MNYDFSRFSPQSFERFAQALIAKKLGPGISIFGAGPDGGREATFQGPLPIATHGVAWDGYVIAQAKYKDNPRGGVEDASWLQKELKADLEKFLDTTRKLKKPEFYIAITNVVLTSVTSSKASGKGGQQKIEELFESYKEKLGLRGWLVWHCDLLSAMLDGEQDIRTRYSAWITEGDVLSSALSALRRPNVTTIVPLALRRDLRKDRDIRRKDAGQITDKRIYLEDVFVDLPLEAMATAGHLTAPASDDDDPGFVEAEGEERTSAERDSEDNPIGLVSRLIERCADKLDPRSLERQVKRASRFRGPTPNRIVLLGGPGQGKSTVAQFLAQLSRARVAIEFLRREPPDLASEAAEAILSRARQEGISLKGPARFPMHVELPKFADAIKQAGDRGEKLSLLRHCSAMLGRESDYRLDPSDLRSWLGDYPWLLILDGLDEVPATGNRSDVTVAINEFLDDVNQVEGDVLVIVTTRPQGYGDDFPRRHWEHWSMANLAPTDAMRFAQRLANVLLSDGSRRDEILGELKRASEDPATAPIMISPLQVSILFSLVETQGGVPADRWSLFQRHYILLRDREAAKEGDTARLLRDYSSQIDQIHYDAGFLLHVRAEASGTADAFLSEKEFELLIHHQLASEGHSSESIENVKQRLVKLATDRLVLLGSKTGGQIAFDVRSLQEFMAAARIMSSPEAAIADRLSEISARTHWRHVFRIAASKAFALTDLTHLRRQIVHICDALDKGDLGSSDMIALSGARLALDLLADNVAARLPDIRRSLVTRAIELLSLGPNPSTLSLLQFLDDDTKLVFETKVAELLKQPETIQYHSASKLLFEIANRHSRYSSWAVNLMLKAWPSRNAEVLRLIDPSGDLPIGKILRDRIFEAQASLPPRESIRLLIEAIGPEPLKDAEIFNFTPAFNWLTYFVDEDRDNSKLLEVRSRSDNPIVHIWFRPIAASKPPAPPAELQHADKWKSLLDLARFMSHPDKVTLASLLRTIVSEGSAEDFSELSLPWPLQLVLSEVTDNDQLLKAAEKIENGSMRDVDDWIKIEEQWASHGLEFSQMCEWAESNPCEFSYINTPDLRNSLRRIENSFLDDAARSLLELASRSITEQKRKWLVGRLIAFQRRPIAKTIRNKIDRLVMSKETRSILTDRQFLNYLRNANVNPPPNMLSEFDRIGRTIGLGLPPGDGSSRSKLIKELKRRKSLRGLLPLVVPMGRHVTRDQEIPVDVLQIDPTDTPAIAAAVEMIRMIQGLETLDDLSKAEEKIVSLLTPVRLLNFLRAIQDSPWLRSHQAIELLTSLCRFSFARDRRFGVRLIDLLKSKLDSRSSRFHDPAICSKLSLPSLLIIAER